ncbi:MAG: GDSL-type esterase/lipase family protein [Polyangiaceae bacterium]|nr:GDSL-type esterase/lipase family protein [Polyangiaceae bacterium]
MIFARYKKTPRPCSVALILACTGLLSACVGSSEHRRGGVAAAYAGPSVNATTKIPFRMQGRFKKKDDGAVQFSWSGSAVSVHFRGTAVSADITDTGNNRYLVLIDGRPAREKIAPAAGRSTIELVKGLKRGEHTVTLYRLTEPLLGETTLHALVLDNYGEALAPVEVARPQILVIGDSISTGYGNEGSNEKCHFSADTENHYLTYEAKAARVLNADLTTIAWSGKGVASNRGSASDTLTMPRLWKRVNPAEELPEVEFGTEQPALVVVNLGTNDFAPEVKDTTAFQPQFEKFAAELRKAYPNAYLLYTVGPLLSDEWPEGKAALSSVRTTLQTIVADAQKAGDSRTGFYEYQRIRKEEGLGCDWHPSVKTHRRMAAELVSALKAKNALQPPTSDSTPPTSSAKE